eukprot:9357291-Pyramimonas_sp.AAC.1
MPPHLPVLLLGAAGRVQDRSPAPLHRTREDLGRVGLRRVKADPLRAQVGPSPIASAQAQQVGRHLAIALIERSHGLQRRCIAHDVECLDDPIGHPARELLHAHADGSQRGPRSVRCSWASRPRVSLDVALWAAKLRGHLQGSLGRIRMA